MRILRCILRRCPALLAASALLAAASVPISPAAAQGIAGHDDEHRWASDGLGEAAFLTLNAAVGGVTAGLWRTLSGGSFEEGLAGGALGGGVVYAGKRLAAESFAGSGFAGRDVAAVGTSMVRNAADGRPLLDSLALPVGPLNLHVSPRRGLRPRVEVNLRSATWLVYGLAEPLLELDVTESLSSGAAVFRAERAILDDDSAVLGVAGGGAIFLSPQGAERRERTLAHERAHVLQADFFHLAWFRPLEERLSGSLPGQGFRGLADYDMILPALRWSVHGLGWLDRFDAPIQTEADFLEER